MANETRPLLVYTYKVHSWERRRFRLQPRQIMAHSIREKRAIILRAKSWRLAPALVAVLAVTGAPAQQPQIGQSFPRQGPAVAANPAESSAYSAAISQSDPNVRASAIQQFLINYPNSSLRQTAIAQMMLAKREAHTPGAPAPTPVPINRAMTPPAVATSPAPAAPAAVPVVAPQPVGPPRDSLLQHPAKPAQVTISPGSLAIKADNSSLSQILHDISISTGMKVEGLGQDERIFGAYGPGDPREVLLSLLEGLGYNVLMVGDDKGAPRELSLSQRSASNTLASAANPRNNREDEEDEVEQEAPPAPPEQAQPVNQPPPGNNPDGTQQPRGPAELQQELLRLRQQQQQQVPQQQPQ